MDEVLEEFIRNGEEVLKQFVHEFNHEKQWSGFKSNIKGHFDLIQEKMVKLHERLLEMAQYYVSGDTSDELNEKIMAAARGLVNRFMEQVKPR
jgi:hypothetical protein